MTSFPVLPRSFYENPNVTSVAKSLLGKRLVAELPEGKTVGRIVETEAYEGITDRAAHSWNNRRTARTEIMFGQGGKVYMYLCYGLHYMFNVVTNKIEHPHAVLIRAVEPLEGEELMAKRTGKELGDPTITRGPGNLCKALGLSKIHNGVDLISGIIRIEDDGFQIKKGAVLATPRIGVDYAGEHARWLYRFILKNNPYVSKTKSLTKK